MAFFSGGGEVRDSSFFSFLQFLDFCFLESNMCKMVGFAHGESRGSIFRAPFCVFALECLDLGFVQLLVFSITSYIIAVAE